MAISDTDLYVELGIRLCELQDYTEEVQEWMSNNYFNLSKEEFDQEMRNLMEVKAQAITVAEAIDILFPVGDPSPLTLDQPLTGWMERLERSNNGNS